MKAAFAVALGLSLAFSLPASAQPSARHSAGARSRASAAGGVETIKPQEAPSRDEGGVNGWNGRYAGVNAGMGFGATAGTNVVVPFGTGDQR
jgi:hypothetical protein